MELLGVVKTSAYTVILYLPIYGFLIQVWLSERFSHGLSKTCAITLSRSSLYSSIWFYIGFNWKKRSILMGLPYI